MRPSTREAKQHKPARRSLVELIVSVVVALGLAVVIQAFLVKPYRIPSASMLPTLHVGQRVLVNRLGNRFHQPHRGEVVVFHPPAGSDTNTCGDPDKKPDQACSRPTPSKLQVDDHDVNYIKRVVAGPGDTLYIKGGHAFVNGTRQKDGFTRPCEGRTGCDLPRPIRIPAGHWFILGDNRGQSGP